MLYTKTNKNHIEKICKKSNDIDFSNVCEDAIENYKKIALYAGLILLMFSVIITIILLCSTVFYVGIENIGKLGNKLTQLSTVKVMPIDVTIYLKSGMLLFIAIISPFMAGFLKMANHADYGEEFHVSSMFSFYNVTYFLNIFLAVFLVGFTTTTFEILFDWLNVGFVGSLISFAISFVTYLSIPLIIFGNVNAVDSIRFSIQLVSRQPIIIFGLMIVSGIGSFLGVFALIIGIFFTYPLTYSMQYSIYKSLVSFTDINEDNELQDLKND
jgi:hypothetical protein